MIQRFTIERSFFERFIAAAAFLQPLQRADEDRPDSGNPPVLLCLLETLRAIDAGELSSQASLERVLDLCLRITGAEGTGLWILTSQQLVCQARVGLDFENDLTSRALRVRLEPEDGAGERLVSSGTSEDDPVAAHVGIQERNGSTLAGPSLLIATLPEGSFTGAVAAYSNRPGAFTRKDGAHLQTLAGLAQYILTMASAVPPMSDLYVPGLGTRSALGVDIGEEKHQPSAFRERIRGLARAPVGLRVPVRRTVDALVQLFVGRLQSASNAIRNATQHGNRFRRRASAHMSVEARALRADLSETVKVSVESLHLAHVSEQSRTSVDHALRRIRRARYWSLRRVIDLLELLHSQSEHWAQWRTAAHFSRIFSQAMRAVAGGRAKSRTLATSARALARENCGRFISVSTQAFASTRSRIREREVTWPGVRSAGPALAALAVMSLFVARLASDRKSGPNLPSAQAQTVEQTRSPDLLRSSTPATVAVPVREETRPQQVPEHSHLKVTDRETAITIAEMTRAEVRTLRRAADYGDDEAAMQLGMLYELGQDMPQSCTEAAKWVTKAAQLGNAAAEYNLGIRYAEGDGVDINLAQAERWLRKAQIHNDRRATHALALLSESDGPH